jgi:hypothetical protein
MPETKLQIDQNLCLDEFSRCRQIRGYLLKTAAEVDAVFLDRLVGNFDVGVDDEFQRGGIAILLISSNIDLTPPSGMPTGNQPLASVSTRFKAQGRGKPSPI